MKGANIRQKTIQFRVYLVASAMQPVQAGEGLISDQAIGFLYSLGRGDILRQVFCFGVTKLV